jgi:hypothetical protein
MYNIKLSLIFFFIITFSLFIQFSYDNMIQTTALVSLFSLFSLFLEESGSSLFSLFCD